MAHLKPSEITRRNFIQRAGLLVTSLGVTGGVQSGLMDSILRRATKKWGGEALAAQAGAVNFMIEVNGRAGLQMSALFPAEGHLTPVASRATDLNFYTDQTNVISYTAPAATKPVYFARFVPGQGGDLLATRLAAINSTVERVGVATCLSVDQITGNHESAFLHRAPNSNTPCPAVLHANRLAPAAPVNGINWNPGGGVQNQTPGGFTPLANVADRTQFQGLYKDLPMFFTIDELKLIVGAIDKGSLVTAGAVDDLDKLFIVKNVPGTDVVQRVAIAGRGQAQLSILAALDSTYTANMGNYVNIATPVGGARLGEALNSALSAFANGAATTMTVNINQGDWHGDIPALNDPASKQAALNLNLGNALAGFLTSAASTPNPFEPGKNIIDSLLITVNSEFGRTPRNSGGNDNGDGGSGNMILIGSKVKSGSRGNITGAGQLQGFDFNTGATTPNNFMTDAMQWKTTGKAMGADDSTLNMYVPMATAAAIPTFFKP